MATYINYNPTSLIGSAMFNFDVYAITNFKLSGTIRLSVSDGFNIFESQALGISDDYAVYGDGEIIWSPSQTSNIQSIAGVLSQFANLAFSTITDYDTYLQFSTANPYDIGSTGLADINITFYIPLSINELGISGLRADEFHGYVGGAGDIFLNPEGSSFNGDLSFSEYSVIKQILMHELGHSLGLAHPHTGFDSSGDPIISADFAALINVGFDKLGFKVDSPIDMYREYFTIMAYDDQIPSAYLNAYTPMILDVIALSQAYGEGAGTHGTGNDTIVAGNVGYRTYFDKGGVDTIDASLYSNGLFLDMGESIIGANHLVGVLMSLDDGINTIVNDGNPASLRWFYGEYENAIGSIADDIIDGNSLNNNILAHAGEDFVDAQQGADSIDGGLGFDTMLGGAGSDTYIVDVKGDKVYETTTVGGAINAGGKDLVQSSVSFTLGSFIENLSLTGIGVINGTGNNQANKITGNDAANALIGLNGADTLNGSGGNDQLRGGTGNDELTGGAGKDKFRFDTVPTANIDTITDFIVVDDTIQLENSIFTALTITGTLAAGTFRANLDGMAQDADDHVIYETDTGNLFYDADGSGAGLRVQIATLVGLPVLTRADFLVI